MPRPALATSMLLEVDQGARGVVPVLRLVVKGLSMSLRPFPCSKSTKLVVREVQLAVEGY